MKTKFNIGDTVVTLVDKSRTTSNGKVFCLKGTKGTVCNNSSNNFVILDVINSKGDWDVFDYGIDEVRLVETSNL